MEKNMIIVTVNLPGAPIGPQKHVLKQIHSVDVSPIGAKKPEKVTKRIKHNDRVPSNCTRKTRLSDEVVAGFQSDECPYWIKSHDWKKMNAKQRLESYLARFDEGYGYSYEYVN